MKCITYLKNNLDLINSVKVFNQPSASKEDILTAGEKFLLYPHGYQESINEVRYYRYNIKTTDH